MTGLFNFLGRVVMLALLCPAAAFAQLSGQQPAFFDDVDVEERLGESIPLDLEFRNEAGEAVRLAEFFDGTRPVVFTLSYHDCPMLCNLILDGFTRTLTDFAWTPGGEFEVVSLSFSADDTPEMAANAKRRFLNELGRPEAADGWHFLTGDQDAIDALTEAVGFRYKWVESQQDYAIPRCSCLREAKARSRVICTESTFRNAHFGMPWSKRPKAASERRSTA
jgi:protein SCO1